MNARVDPAVLKRQINNLLLRFPELADDDQLRADMIEGETGLEEALSSYVRKILETSALRQGTDHYVSQLVERMNRLDRRIEAYRALIFDLMEAAGQRKMELPEATLSVRKVPPKVIITDEDSLPPLVMKTVYKPDISKIKDLLMDGTCSGATLSNGSETLSLRIK